MFIIKYTGLCYAEIMSMSFKKLNVLMEFGKYSALS